jgi:AcrR family transcriptional regulator
VRPTSPAVPKETGEQRTVIARPADRREQIDRHAAELFAVHGFPATRLEDIASAVGFTARALYRHYPSKKALLFHLTHRGQDAYLDALTDDPDVTEPGDRLLRALSRLADVMQADHTHALLWQREARHLDPDQRAVIRARVVDIAAGLATFIAESRQETSETSELRAWAVLAVLASTGHQTPPARGKRTRDRLLTVSERIAEAPALCDTAEGALRLFRNQPVLTSRREQTLVAAARLFRRRGFALVSVEDIGQSIGILGPSIYHHFDSKQSILAALVHRLNEWLSLAVLDAQGRGSDAAESVEILTRSYVEFALNFPDLVSVTLTEALYLAEEDAELNRVRASLFTAWAAMLCQARPELTEATAILLVHAATSMIDDLVRIPHLRNENLPTRIAGLAHLILRS